MSKTFILAGLTVAGLVFASSARAALTFTEVARWQTFTQSSNAAPGSPNSFGFTARVFSNTANEVQNGTVKTPLATVYNMNPSGAFVTGYSNFSFASEAALDALFPTGSYEFTLTNGPRSGDSDTIDFNDPGWADVTPHLVGTNYADLQGADVTSAISFNWSAWDTTGSYTGRQTYFTLIDVTGGGTQVVPQQQGHADTFLSKTLAANTLVAGRTYQYTLTFGALDQSEEAEGLAPARPTAAKYMTTSGRFTTAVPEPGTIAVLALGVVGAFRRRRR